MQLYNKDNFKWDIDLLYVVDGYYTIKMFVESNGFIGKYNFCINDIDICNIINDITNILSINEDIIIKIRDRDSDSFISIYQNSKSLTVFGQLGSSIDNNMLKFKNTADITLISILKQALLLIKGWRNKEQMGTSDCVKTP